jgi:hypothetical protein
VSLARALILFCSVLALSACGSARSVQPADNAQVAPLPPPHIEAIDEPADTWWMDGPGDGATGSTYICAQEEDSKTTTDKGCNPTPEMKEELRRQAEGTERATTPAKDFEPRAIARLRLDQRGRNARLRLIAWKSQPGELCLADDETDDEGGGRGGPFGPCVPGGHCGAICLPLSGSGTGTEWLSTTAGVVPATADLLRITFDGGRVSSYKLDGPLVPGFPEYRVFMLDLGRGIETRLELFEGDKVIAEEKRSDAEIRRMRCWQTYPVDDMPRTPEEAEKSPLAKCFEKARSE